MTCKKFIEAPLINWSTAKEDDLNPETMEFEKSYTSAETSLALIDTEQIIMVVPSAKDLTRVTELTLKNGLIYAIELPYTILTELIKQAGSEITTISRVV